MLAAFCFLLLHNVSLAANVAYTASGTITASCSGTRNRRILVCPNFGAGSGGSAGSGNPRYMLQGATRLNYNLYEASNYTNIWGSNLWAPRPNVTGLVINLNNAGTASPVSKTIYGRITAGQGARPPGAYLSTFAGNDALVQYAYTNSNSTNCNSSPGGSTQSVPFTVTANAVSSCVVTTTALDFGTQTSLAAGTATTNSVSVTCTAGTQFEVGMNNGSSGGTDPAARLMTNAGTPEAITYGIYRDPARTSPWGATAGGNTQTGTGTGAAQAFTGYGYIPSQPTPPPLVYTDTVVVTVTY
jgi:spore coat protein U-like protein